MSTCIHKPLPNSTKQMIFRELCTIGLKIVWSAVESNPIANWQQSPLVGGGGGHGQKGGEGGR